MANDVELSSLIVEIDADASTAGKQIDSVASALSRLNSGSKLTRTINNLNNLHTALTKYSSLTSAVNALNQISTAVQRLSSVQKMTGLNSALNTLKKFPTVVSGLNTSNLTALASSIQPLSTALSGLTGVEKLSSLNSAFNTLKKLPDIAQSLANMDMDAFATQLERVKTAIQPLASELQKVSSGFAAMPTQVQKVISANTKLGTSTDGLSAKFGKFSISVSGALSKLTLFGIGIQRVAQYLGQSLANYNSFVENVNLFTVSMGDFTSEAASFTQAMQDILGVDASEAMRNMGVIQNLVTSFGASADQAYVLSKNLTQLGYDFASFFNISTEDAFTKLQAAISGELEPIRRLGVDISEARLQQELYNLGINESVQNLSQADKALLRYIAIMDQTSNAQTDMARTLNSPANQIRILQAQIDLLSRSIGSLLIPMLNAVLPPLIAAVQIIREFISAIAAFFGVEVSFESAGSSVSSAAGSISSGLDDVADSASGAAEEISYLIGGFDELNVLSSSSGSGSGSDSGAGSLLGGVSLPEYDMFSGLAESEVAKWVEKLRGPLTTVLKIALAIGAAFLAWKIGSAIITGANLLKTAWSFVKDTLLIVAGQFENIGTSGQKILAFLKPITNALGISAGTLISIVAAVVIIVARFTQLYIASETFRQGLANIWEIIKSIGSGVWNGFVQGIQPAVNAVKTLGDDLINLVPQSWEDSILTFFSKTLPDALSTLNLDVGDLIITLAGIGLLFVPGGQVLGVVLLAFETISVAIRGMGLLTDEQLETIKSGFKTAFEWIGKIIGGIISAAVTTITASFGGIIQFVTGPFTGQWDSAIKGLLNVVTSVFQGIGAFIDSVFGTNIVDTVKGAINTIADFFNKLIGFVNDAFTINFSGLNIAGKQVVPAINANLINLPLIPHLADGGVLKSPQVVLAGEYSGAASNPEIVSPRSLMRDTVMDANEDMVIAIVAAIQALQQTVEDKDFDVSITEGDVGRAAVAYGTRQRRRTGKNPFSA